MNEIERKFLIRTLPGLSGLTPIVYERYFLEITDSFEDRIQKKGEKYERERKYTESNLTARKEKEQISKEEFESLKANSIGSILRTGYKIKSEYGLSIKIYHGKHEGLVRAEVEFENETQAREFRPPDWFEEEITNSPLGKDSRLVLLSEEEFKNSISRHK